MDVCRSYFLLSLRAHVHDAREIDNITMRPFDSRRAISTQRDHPAATSRGGHHSSSVSFQASNPGCRLPCDRRRRGRIASVADRGNSMEPRFLFRPDVLQRKIYHAQEKKTSLLFCHISRRATGIYKRQVCRERSTIPNFRPGERVESHEGDMRQSHCISWHQAGVMRDGMVVRPWQHGTPHFPCYADMWGESRSCFAAFSMTG